MRFEDLEIKMDHGEMNQRRFWVGRIGKASFLFPRDNKATAVNKMKKIKQILIELGVYENDQT